MNSIYVLEIVLAILLSEMRPMPDIRPKNKAITNEIIAVSYTHLRAHET